MNYTFKELERILKKNGWKLVKSNGGSHQKFRHTQTGRTIPVPRHSKEIKKHLFENILKEVGLKEEMKK